MKISRRMMLISLATAAATSALPAFAAQPLGNGTTITGALWDNPDKAMAMGLGHGMGGDMSLANMAIRLDRTEVPVGRVTFDITNDSADFVHEMVVMKLSSPDEILPYDSDAGEVNEDAIASLGEVSELDPGQSGTLSVDLTPGQYLLFCNVPGHYTGGMWTVLTAS